MGGYAAAASMVLGIVAAIIPLVLPAKTRAPYGGPKMGDQVVTSSAYGADINALYGTNRLAGNLIWTGGIIEVATTTTEQGVGKGGGNPSTTTYSYFASFQVALARGIVGNVIKIFCDGKVIQDKGSIASFSEPNHDVELYNGDEEQLISAIIAADEGPNTPANRGVAYLLADLMPLANYGNRIPNVTAVVCSVRTLTYPYTLIERNYPDEGLFTSVSEMRVDHQRGFIWGIRMSPLAVDHIERYDYIESTLVFDKALVDYYLDGEYKIASLTGSNMAITSDGDLLLPTYYVPGGAGTWGVSKVDQHNGEVVGHLQFGTNPWGGLLVTEIPFSGTSPTGAPVGTDEVWMMTNGGGGAIQCGGVTPFLLYPTTGTLAWGSAGPYSLARDLTADAMPGRVWHTAAGTSVGLEEMFCYSRVFDCEWFPGRKIDIGGNDALVPYGWENGNPEGVEGLGKTFNTPNVSPVVGYGGADDTFTIILSHAFWYEWRIGKFDLTLGVMVEIRQSEDYEASTSTDEFAYPLGILGDTNTGGLDGDMVYGEVGSTFYSYPAYLTGGAGIHVLQRWYGIAQMTGDPHVIPIDSLTLQFDESYDQWRQWNSWGLGVHTSAGSQLVHVYGRDSFYGNAWISGHSGDPYPMAEWFMNRFDPFGMTLEEVVAQMCREAGLKDHQFDTSGLAGISVRGTAFSQRAAVKDNFSILMLVYDFTYVESDWQIKFVRRGNASAFTILDRDLGVGAKGGLAEVLELRRASELELYMSLETSYLDANRDYQDNLAAYKRTINPVNTVNTLTHDSIALPIVLSPEEAAEITKRSLGRMWSEQLQMTTQLSPKHIGVDPTDVITITADGETRESRVIKADIGADRLLKIGTTVEDAGLLELSITGVQGKTTIQTRGEIVFTELLTLDTSLLRDIDEEKKSRYVLYSGFVYPRTGFPGADAYIGNRENGLKAWFSENRALEWGKSFNTLGYVGTDFETGFGSSQTLDTINTVDIWMVNGTLASATDIEGFYDGDPETGGVKGILGEEIIQAYTATLNGDGSYTLSNLLRGRRGTEWAVANHTPGEKFIPLTESQPFNRSSYPGSQVGRSESTSKYTVAVTNGLAFDDMYPKNVFFRANSLRPYSPCQVEGERDASDNLNVRWVRRNRILFEAGWGDGEPDELALTESAERYRAVLIAKGTFDPFDWTAWSEHTEEKGNYKFEVTRNFGFADNGDGTATIDVYDGTGMNFNRFKTGSWLELSNFDYDEMNTYAIVISTNGTTDMVLKIPDAGSDSNNVDSVIRQLPTHVQFDSEDIADAGYDTSEPVDVVVYQFSGLVGRGRPGFDVQGVDR